MSSVTFIIPTIGRETLSRALESLYRQSVSTWKAIIVFDGISPNIEVTDPRVTITRCDKSGTSEIVNGIEKANGAGYVRNFGIARAETEWIAFLDDDDTLAYTYLENLHNEIHLCHNVDVVIFRMLHPDYGVLPKPSSTHFQKYEVGISFAIKRSIVGDNVRFVSGHDEDYIFLCSARENGHKIVMSPYVKYFVHNVGHSEKVEDMGRRMVINCSK